MRPFLDCHGNISSLRGSHTVQGEMVRWVRAALIKDGASLTSGSTNTPSRQIK
jgi:hypothetical protein